MINETWLDDNGVEITEEFVIISKTKLLKKIEEWVNKFGNEDSESVSEAIHLFQSLSSQSTPLNPLLENTFDAGYKTKQQGIFMKTVEFEKQKQFYIKNLNL